MKRYIYLMAFLTLLVVTPVIYQYASEAKRQRTIAQIREQAKQIDAIRPGEALRLAKAQGKETLLILYTGNTQGHLEPCGCYTGQSGGIARRKTVIDSFRQNHLDPLILEASGIFDGDTELDQLRTSVYLQAMERIGYHAVGLGRTEFQFGQPFLQEQLSTVRAPFISTNLTDPSLSSLIKTAQILDFQKRRVGIFALTAPSTEHASEVALTETSKVLDNALSSLETPLDLTCLLVDGSVDAIRQWVTARNDPSLRSGQALDVIISNQPGEDEKIGKTLLLHCAPRGKTLGMLSLSLSGPHQIADYLVHQISLKEDVPDDAEIRTLLSEFYKRVAEDARFQTTTKRLFSGEPLENESQNGYTGSEACRTCHSAEYQQWSVTSHAVAYNTLQTIQKHFHPECVLCHVTGFGYPTGYQIGQQQDLMQNVGCETCHGPGQRHVENPKTANTRGKVPTALCLECHNAEHAPGFDQVAHLLRREVDHSEKVAPLEGILKRRMRGTLKPKVELFVMSFCPAGTQAEKQLLPFIQELGDQVDFNLHYLGKVKEDSNAKPGEDYMGFTSSHGRAEVIEDMRQVALAHYYPDHYLDYILCRANHLQESWEKCAQKFNIDTSKIDAIVHSEAGARLYRANIQRTHELEIHASPTLLIDGRKHDVWVFQNKVRGVCQ